MRRVSVGELIENAAVSLPPRRRLVGHHHNGVAALNLQIVLIADVNAGVRGVHLTHQVESWEVSHRPARVLVPPVC